VAWCQESLDGSRVKHPHPIWLHQVTQLVDPIQDPTREKRTESVHSGHPRSSLASALSLEHQGLQDLLRLLRHSFLAPAGKLEGDFHSSQLSSALSGQHNGEAAERICYVCEKLNLWLCEANYEEWKECWCSIAARYVSTRHGNASGLDNGRLDRRSELNVYSTSCYWWNNTTERDSDFGDGNIQKHYQVIDNARDVNNLRLGPSRQHQPQGRCNRATKWRRHWRKWPAQNSRK